ncbi:hypothetical protein DZF91_05115 [Actinomadura logoneensis]|uniref:Uncharacterized protein n=1 Tax=Actinomadura logoneensis TaxID=2293572 RepID=A0A372JRQ8_9ACTN|nr:hypothetical protein [Actinomadura logoneensis]RFU42702.1 hypothetical protein DZF91_05115 [Actinomadura logoneensis]
MRFRDRFGIRKNRGTTVAKLDREATDADIEALIAFARSRPGVEFYVEPETFATDTTAVAVANDGEWTRRRVGSPKVIGKVARDLGMPIYDVQIVGYPPRMRAWNERNRNRRIDPGSPGEAVRRP